MVILFFCAGASGSHYMRIFFAVGFETRSSAGCVKDTPLRLFRVFLDHGNPTLSQPSRPIPAVSRTPVFLAAGSFTDVLGISKEVDHDFSYLNCGHSS